MWVRFTRPDGSPVDLDPATILRLAPNGGAYNPAAKTVLFTTTGPQAVKETFEQVEKLLKV